MPETVYGLPTHALVVHAVVVLVPLCALGVFVMLFSTLWRDRLRWPVLILLTGALVSTFVARQTGEWLQLTLRAKGVANADINRHVSLGLKAFWIVGIFWVLVVVWLYLDRRRPPTQPTRVLGVVAAVAALFATGWIVATGHAGSNAVWKGVIAAPAHQAVTVSSS